MSIKSSFKCFALPLLTCYALVSICAGQVDLLADSDAHPAIAVRRASLGSNLDIVFIKDDRFPVVTIHMYIPNTLPPSSRADDIPPEDVLRRIFGDMLRASEGGDIGGSLRALGASMSVSSSPSSNWIVIRGVCLRSHVGNVVRIMSDLLSPDGFQRGAIERKINELAQRQSIVDPMAQVRRLMWRYTSLDHQIPPSNLPSASILDHEEAIVRAVVSDYGRRRLPQGVVVAVSGRVDFGFIVRLFRNTFRYRIEHRESDVPLQSKLAAHEEGVDTFQCRFIEVSKPSASEVALGFGTSAVGPSHPDFPALVVLHHILGSGPGSRIHNRIRIEEGLSYRVFSDLEMFSTHSLFGVYTVFDSSVATVAMTALSGEIGTLLDKGITVDELIDAQRALVGQEFLALESPGVQLHKLIIRGELSDLGRYWRSYLSSISSVTQDDIERVARLYLAPSRLVGVAAGNPTGVLMAKQSLRKSDLMDDDCFEDTDIRN